MEVSEDVGAKGQKNKKNTKYVHIQIANATAITLEKGRKRQTFFDGILHTSTYR